MDEEIGIACPWPQEDIPSGDYLSRHIHVQSAPKDKLTGRRFPSEACFSLKQGENGLSKYWNKYIKLEEIYFTIALSYGVSGNYKDYTSFKVYQIEKGYIEQQSELIQVVHYPTFQGNPSPVGKPNNRSHSLIIFPEAEDLLQIRMNLADYCREKHETSFRDFDVTSIKDKVEELRKKNNDTPYHKI